MKSKRAKEFIRNSAFSAIQLPGEVMYSIHMNVEGKLLDRKSAERAVELAEQDAEEEIEDKCKGFVEILEKQIEALKKRAVEAHRKCCFFRNDSRNECANTGTQCGEHSCFYMDVFIQKLNDL